MRSFRQTILVVGFAAALMTLMLTLTLPQNARAQEDSPTSSAKRPGARRFGLGLLLGSPTAITGKYWTGQLNAVDLGFSYASNYYILILGDYLWHYPGLFGHGSPFVDQLLPYFGVGAGFYNWAPGYNYLNRPYAWTFSSSNVGLYARIPFGVEWYPTKPPLGVFVEIAPGVTVIPAVSATIDIGIGIRYYF